jgi:hypothetical protein
MFKKILQFLLECIKPYKFLLNYWATNNFLIISPTLLAYILPFIEGKEWLLKKLLGEEDFDHFVKVILDEEEFTDLNELTKEEKTESENTKEDQPKQTVHVLYWWLTVGIVGLGLWWKSIN